MKSFAILAGALFLVGTAPQQVTLPAPLAKDLDKLAASPTLKVTYKFRQIGQAATEYTLELGKPNLFRLSSETGFTLSDGKTIYTYTKDTNKYTETPVTDDSIAEFAHRPEVLVWSGFLLKKAPEEFAAARAGEDQTVSGVSVSTVEFTLKKGATSGKFFIDKKLGVARGAELKVADKDYLSLASEVVVGTMPSEPEKYAFVTPSGAQKVEPAAANEASFAQVQEIVNANCMPCHSGGNRRGGFDLSNYDGIKKAVTPGASATSTIIIVTSKKGPGQMPPNKSLPADQIAKIAKWIDAGAKNP